MNRTAIVIATLLVTAPASLVQARDNCGWCGADAQAPGRALNMGGPVACYCPPPPSPRTAKPTRSTSGHGEVKPDKRVESKNQ